MLPQGGPTPVIIAHISDSHLARQGTTFAGEAELARSVDHLLRLPARPDVVLLTGDLTDNGHPAEYARVRELLAPLPMPVYAVPGNHDNREAFLEAFGTPGEHPLAGFSQYVVEADPLRLIALDTVIPGSGAGELDAERLEWLEARLAEAPGRPTLLFMHHPPFELGLLVSDSLALQHQDAFAALVARHPQVEAVVAGHVHATLVRRFAGTLALSAGSTRAQWLYDLGQPGRLAVRMEPPSCLLHVWNARTGLLTHSSLIGQDDPTTLLHDGERWL